MSKSINKRVDTIKDEHAKLLNMVKEKISENSTNFQNNANEVMAVLKYDEKNIKKYEAMVNAQELIVSLTKQIIEAKSVEEVVAIRKKLNYYINKIKEELKKREVSEEVINNYNGQANTLRKSIAQYIRFIKREDNIAEIDNLYSNYDNLSSEELTNLKKCLAREKRYNKRNFNAFDENKLSENTNKRKEAKKAKVLDKNDEKPIEIKNGFVFKKEIIEEAKMPVFSKEDFDLLAIDDTISQELNNRPKLSKADFDVLGTNNTSNDMMFITGEVPYEESSKYFTNRVRCFDEMYDVTETFDYNKSSFGKNILSFFRNIPRYIHNKKDNSYTCYIP